jgi:hypothetical protein
MACHLPLSDYGIYVQSVSYLTAPCGLEQLRTTPQALFTVR